MISSEWVQLLSNATTSSNQENTFFEMQIIKETEQHLVYKALLSCIDLYHRWCTTFKEKPTQKVARNSKEMNSWKNKIVKETIETEQKISNFLSSLHFVEVEGDDSFSIEIALIREIYFPRLVMWIHHVLVSTHDLFPGNGDGTPNNVIKSILLVNEVAKDDRLLREMKLTGYLNQFIDAIRKSSLLSLEYSQNLSSNDPSLRNGNNAHKLKELPWCSI